MGGGLSSSCLQFLKRKDVKLSQEMQNLRSSPRIDLTKAPDPYRKLKINYETSPVVFLGQGGHGSVFRVTCRGAGCSRAVKQICRAAVDRDALRRELQLLLELDHPHIIRLNHWFEDEYSVYLVTELATGGDLLSRCPSGAGAEAGRLFGQLMRAVRYFHDRGIAHRDLKGQNCLLTGDVLRPTVKVIDFGVAMVQDAGVAGDEWLDGRVGTLSHMAPEVLQPGRKYGLKCDIWSAGVVLFMLVTGSQPFPKGCGDQVPAKAEGGCLPKRLLERIPAAGAGGDLEALLRGMLSWDPEARPEAQAVLRNPWISSTRETAIDRKTLRHVLAWSLSGATPMRQAVATATAHTLQEEEVAKVRSTFLAIDTEGRGYLSKGAIGEAFRTCGLELEARELASLFAALDRERSGRVSWTDWLTAALRPDCIASEQHLKLALTYIDLNNDGSVSPSELTAVLGRRCAEAAVVRWDSDGDRRLSMEEVKAAMQGIAALKAELARSPTVGS